jgi:hypothetical protein
MKYLILLLVCVACGGGDFKKVERLKGSGFRVLGISTSQPEVSPGTTVSDIRVYFSDVGGGRVISGTTVSCIDPGIALGARVNCDHDPSRVSGTYNINTSAEDQSGGLFVGLSTATASVTVPAQIFLGRSAKDQSNGVGYIIIFTFDVAGEKITAFKRIVATTRAVKNSNPSGTVLLNGAPIAALPNKDDKLLVSSTSAESYDYENIDGSIETRTEQIQVAWYISYGTLNKPKTFANEETEFLDDRPAGLFSLVAVIRDERGGISFVRF